MQVIQLDLKKLPEIKDFLVDKEPGDEVCVYATIKSLDDQTAVLTIEEIGDPMDDKEEKDEGDGADTAAPGDNMDSPQAGEGPDPAGPFGGREKSAL